MIKKTVLLFVLAVSVNVSLISVDEPCHDFTWHGRLYSAQEASSWTVADAFYELQLDKEATYLSLGIKKKEYTPLTFPRMKELYNTSYSYLPICCAVLIMVAIDLYFIHGYVVPSYDQILLSLTEIEQMSARFVASDQAQAS